MRCNLTSLKFCQVVKPHCILQERGWIQIKDEMKRVWFFSPSSLRNQKARSWRLLRDWEWCACIITPIPFPVLAFQDGMPLFSFPHHLQLHCSSAIIWFLDKTAWSTLVTLEIRIWDISWQAISEHSNQVSKDSVGCPEKDSKIMLSIPLCSYLPDGWPIATRSESMWTLSRMALKHQKPFTVRGV